MQISRKKLLKVFVDLNYLFEALICLSFGNSDQLNFNYFFKVVNSYNIGGYIYEFYYYSQLSILYFIQELVSSLIV